MGPSVVITKGDRGVVTDGSVRLGPMFAWPRVLDDFGIETDAMLAGLGLERADFDDPETVLSFRAVDALMVRSTSATACDHLGVLIGRHATLSSLGAVGFLMKASPTVGEALALLQRHLQVQDRGAVVHLSVVGAYANLRYLITVPGLAAIDQLYTIAALVGRNLMRGMCGRPWRPTEVELPFSPPPHRMAYQQAFDAPLRFDADRVGIVFPASDLARPLPSADPFLSRMMAERISQLEADMQLGLPDNVRRLLRTRIFVENTTSAFVAHRLGITVRTLHRRLAEAGTSVRALRDEVACDAACQLLSATAKPAGEIAGLLGYSDASAFTRAFRRWRGVAPARWRARAATPAR